MEEESESSGMTPLDIYIEILKCHMNIIESLKEKDNINKEIYLCIVALINKLKILSYTDELKDTDLILHSYSEVTLSIEKCRFCCDVDDSILKVLTSVENYLSTIFYNL